MWNLHCISKYIAEVFICNFTAKWRRLCIDLFCYLRRLNLKSQQAEAYKYLLYAWAACTIYLHMSIYLSRGVYIYIHMNVYTFTWDAYLDPSQFHRGNEAHLCCEVTAWTPFALSSPRLQLNIVTWEVCGCRLRHTHALRLLSRSFLAARATAL